MELMSSIHMRMSVTDRRAAIPGETLPSWRQETAVNLVRAAVQQKKTTAFMLQAHFAK
jgi:hypothetical protein